MRDLSAFGEAVQSSSFGVWAGGEIYPIANLVHLLRLIGLFRRIPTAALAAALTPIAIAGLLLMIPSGATMFASDASTLVNSSTFRTKLLLIAAALANAIAFRFLWRRRVGDWESSLPTWGRVMAMLSLSLWLSVAGLGRWIAYS